MKKIFSFMLILLVIFTIASVSAAEDNLTEEITLEEETILTENEEGYVDATEAYEALNEFRTEENVWYWNSDDETQSHVNTNDTVWLKPLQRDVELENTAKIRAKEISEYFSHTRPDGTSCFEIFPEGLLDYGENIAYGYETGFDVTEGWKETGEPYSGQGHRRNMLLADYNYVGIAGYKVNGVTYWVQNFGCRNDPKDISSDSSIYFSNNTKTPKFTIDVPLYASGIFEVYVNNTLISSKSVSNGKADITVCGLNPGTYEIFLSYSGDYNCKPLNRTETVIISGSEIISGPLTFNHLNTLIQMVGDEIKLENDYCYSSDLDSLFCEGISISKQLVIDGQGHKVDGKNIARIFKIRLPVELKNITLINGNANSVNNENRYFDDSSYGVTSYYFATRPERNGGAIYSYATLSIINSTFSDNNAFCGGAIFSSSNVYVENSVFSDNIAGDDGGAVYAWGYVSLTDSSFTYNGAVDLGAAVYTSSTLESANSTFTNNYNSAIYADKFINTSNIFIDDEYMKLFFNATFNGGIVYLNRNYNATGTVIVNASNVVIDGRGYTIDAKHKTRLFNITGDNVVIKNLNVVNGISVNEGGAIHVSSSKITIINSTFSNCIAQMGGVIYGNITNVTVINSNFTNNGINDFAGNDVALGGVICTETGTISVSDSCFISNFAFDGGALRADCGSISIKNSYFENNSASVYGGGAVSSGISVNVNDSIFIRNYANRYGGAIFCYENAKTSIRNSTFENNTSHHYGGAVSAAVWTEIINSLFTGNSATDYAGAISVWGNLSIEDSNFTKNSANYAGAIFDYSQSSTVSISHSNFADNIQKSNGAIELTNNAFVSDSTFINNHAYDGVGGAIVSNQNLTVSNSVFTNNSVVRLWGYSVGGAIINYGQNLNVKHSVFTDNSAQRGGAIISFDGNTTVDFSSFINNSAYEGGAFLRNGESRIFISNSVFENNTADYGGALYGCDAFNCTFTKNMARNLASSIYGDSNTAEKCTFKENIDYSHGPNFGVNEADCTFTNNRMIITGEFASYYLQKEYYQGETLFMQVYSYIDYTYLNNVTVTIRAYKNNVLSGEFEYLSGDGWTVDIAEGNYTFCFSVENPDYEITEETVNLTVIKKEIANVQITIDSNTFEEPTTVEIISNLDGSIAIYIDDNYIEYTDVTANEALQLTYNYIFAGNHTFRIDMIPSNYHYDSKTFTKEFYVAKKHVSLTLNVEKTSDTENVIVKINTNESGTVNVRLDGIEENVYVYAGSEKQVDFGDLKTGMYVVSATFYGDDNYETSNVSITFNVLDKITYDDIKISKDNSNNLTINLPKNTTGNVTLTIAGESYNIDVVDGIANVILPNLTGVFEYTITYSGDDKYGGFSITGSLNTSSTGETVKITPEMEVSEFTNTLTQVILPVDATGSVTFIIAGENHTFEVKNGVADIELPDLKNGNYEYTIVYSGDGKYASFSKKNTLTVDNPVEIIASDAKVIYSAGSLYKITVKDYGKVKVSVKINGKAFKTLTTDSNGACSFKVTQNPGTYKVQIQALGYTLTKTLTVKHIVTLKKVTVKKSAKKLTLQASLSKVNKKYLKNKKITFKFNGKKYTAKTNAKGVAKVTIKKAVLKKLKVGKKITYSATFLKDTVKVTVKVKK